MVFPLLARLTTLSAAFVLSVLAVTLALAAGRARPETDWQVAVVGSTRSGIAYRVSDPERYVHTTHSLDVPRIVDWQVSAASSLLTSRRFSVQSVESSLILQVSRHDDGAVYTLSLLDPIHALLTPLMRIRVGSATTLYARYFAIYDTPDGLRVAVYLSDGGVWLAERGDPAARLLATVEPDITGLAKWSPDGSLLMIPDEFGTSLALVHADTGASATITIPRTQPLAYWLVWSPDSRHVLLAPLSSISENRPIRVIDAAAGEIMAQTASLEGHLAAWCDSGTIAYVVIRDDGHRELRLFDLAAGHVETVVQVETFAGQTVLDITPDAVRGCERLTLTTRHYSERGNRTLVIDGTSGTWEIAAVTP